MKNENFKIINERWDSYVKEQEPLNENAVQFTNDLLASGTIANYNAIYGLILMGLKSAAFSYGGYVGLRAIARFLIKQKGQDKVFQDIEEYFNKLISENPDKQKNLQRVSDLVYRSFKVISQKSYKLVNPELVKKELENIKDTTPTILQTVTNKLKKYVASKLEQDGEGITESSEVYIAAAYADEEGRKVLEQIALSDKTPESIERYLKNMSNYNPRTGALRPLNNTPRSTPTKDPEGREVTPSGLALPSGDDIKKFG
tara:strand:+ start:10216 stop:10989 length:774 start_codon:yes stop_codon:yes gene_type:complete